MKKLQTEGKRLRGRKKSKLRERDQRFFQTAEKTGLKGTREVENKVQEWSAST